MKNKKLKRFISISIGLLSLNGLLFNTTLASDVQNTSDLLAEKPAQPMCYSMPVQPVIGNKDNKELQEEYDRVEALYKDKKINKETYDIRINKIKTQMKPLK